ncbi:peptide transporter, partial [Rhizobium ruizarguesonis]
PKPFFITLVVWTIISINGWYFFAAGLGSSLGFVPVPEEQQPIDLTFFLLPENLWFYGYFLAIALIFCGFWHLKAMSHPW